MFSIRFSAADRRVDEKMKRALFDVQGRGGLEAA